MDMRVNVIRRKLASLRRRLIQWWRRNGRRFPWRKTRNPYRILVAEVLLHRTRADQVLPVYKYFLRKYPTIEAIGSTSVRATRKDISQLGLRWRADKLHEMANIITRKYSGKIPLEPKLLRELPGISDYIASAVACFVRNSPEIILDTNTVRIVGRVFGVRTTDASRRDRRFVKMYSMLLDNRHPREFNYAMLDLGALICKPAEPRCDECPLNSVCSYASHRHSRYDG